MWVKGQHGGEEGMAGFQGQVEGLGLHVPQS